MKHPITDVSKLVIHALRGLKKTQPCTIHSIRTFITKNYAVRQNVAQKIPLAVKKGVACGVIKKNNNNYKLDPIMTMVAAPQKDIVEMRRRRRSRGRRSRGRRSRSRRRRRRRRSSTSI